MNRFILSQRGDIPDAVAWLEKSAGSFPPAVSLLCEELLVHLTETENREITLSLHRALRRYAEICAPGEPDDLEPDSAVGEEQRIEREIRRNLFRQYAGSLDIRRKKGVNVYRIYLDSPAEGDLCEELNAFYETAADGKPVAPLSSLVYLAKRHKGRFILAILVKTMKHLGALMLPVFAANIIDAVGQVDSFFSRPVLLSILGSVVSLAVNLICFWIDANIYHSFTRAVESAFKMAIVRKLQLLSMRYHSSVQSGKLLSKLISDVQFIGQLIYERLTDVLHLCIDVVFVIAVAWSRFPAMLLFYVVIVPASVLFVRRAAGPVLKSKAAMRSHTETSNAAFKEMLDMEGLTRSQGMQKTEYRNVYSKVRRVQDSANSYDRLGVWVNNITYGGAQGFRLICLCFAAFLAIRGYISVGTVVLFQSVFEMIINSVQKVLDELPQITQGYDSLISVNEILLEKDVEKNGTVRLPEPVRGEIEFRDVVLRYEEDRRPILDGVSLHIPAGSSAAFVGESGAGKTSAMNLMMGLLPAQSGQILIDGLDLDTLDKNSYRRHIAVVPQNTVLLSGTLWDNLVYGLQYVSVERVLDVLKSVGLEDLLHSLPDGLDSEIYENGSNLSGGQRQRIAIARALLRDAKIIFFDEATSALDAKSEKQVQDAIDAVMKTCTVVMVAHRLNTLKKVDRIYRLEDGKATLCRSYEEVVSEEI